MANRGRRRRLHAWGATVLTAASGAAAVAFCPPGAVPVRADDPTSAVVAAAAWVAWALGGYLLLSTAVVALASAPGAVGRGAGRLRRFAPPALRRLVDLATGTAVVASIGIGTAPAVAAPPSPTAPAAASLEWPGLPPAPAPARPGRVLVVQDGDSLWSLAAGLLGPHATARSVAREWPRLYAANRGVIGANPDLIHPGQRLLPPADDERTTR